jgi:isocitrate/isopropylmalate dehydrogenase
MVMPEVELRFTFDLYAGMRPARLIPGVPSPTAGASTRSNAFKAYAYFRSIFDERAKNFPGVRTDHAYVDACAALMVRKPSAVPRHRARYHGPR